MCQFKSIDLLRVRSQNEILVLHEEGEDSHAVILGHAREVLPDIFTDVTDYDLESVEVLPDGTIALDFDHPWAVDFVNANRGRLLSTMMVEYSKILARKAKVVVRRERARQKREWAKARIERREYQRRKHPYSFPTTFESSFVVPDIWLVDLAEKLAARYTRYSHTFRAENVLTCWRSNNAFQWDTTRTFKKWGTRGFCISITPLSFLYSCL